MPTEIRDFLIYTTNIFFNLLTVFIVIRILMSWVAPHSQGKFAYFIYSITEPVLNIFKRLPLRIGMLDFSALVALFAIGFVQSLIIQLLVRF